VQSEWIARVGLEWLDPFPPGYGRAVEAAARGKVVVSGRQLPRTRVQRQGDRDPGETVAPIGISIYEFAQQ